MEAHVSEKLPRTQTFEYYESEPNENQMEFRLIYEGPLPPEKWSYSEDYARAIDKHRLRKHFHLQLREMWKQHPDLRSQAEELFIRKGGNRIHRAVNPNQLGAKTWVDYIADDHQRCGGRFVPLVSELGGFTCSLDILFLRRGHPGDLLISGGDIDSRLKVLVDGLKMPKVVPELGGLSIEADENPFYCLLEDDKLVTKISVTTDRLLVPLRPDKPNDVILIVNVTVVNPGQLFAGGRLV